MWRHRSASSQFKPNRQRSQSIHHNPPEEIPSIQNERPNDPNVQLEDLRCRVGAVEGVLAVDGKSALIADLESVTLEPGFWDDQTKAQQVMAQISKHREELQMVTGWKGTLDDICVALELHAENDAVRSVPARLLHAG
jgi:hypothetical protein